MKIYIPYNIMYMYPIPFPFALSLLYFHPIPTMSQDIHKLTITYLQPNQLLSFFQTHSLPFDIKFTYAFPHLFNHNTTNLPEHWHLIFNEITRSTIQTIKIFPNITCISAHIYDSQSQLTSNSHLKHATCFKNVTQTDNIFIPLTQCANLSRIIFLSSSSSPLPLPHHSPFTFPKLKSLAIFCSLPINLFTLLHLPKIKHIRIPNASQIQELFKYKTLMSLTICSLSNINHSTNLNNLTNLTKLTIRNITIIIPDLLHLPNMRILKLSFYSTFPHNTTLTFLKSFTNLRILHIINNHSLETLEGLESCKNLRKLIILGCPNLSTTSSLQHLSSLTHTNIHHNHPITIHKN